MSCTPLTADGCLTPSQPASNRVISFTASYSLEGDYQASAVFSDPNCEDTPLCQVLCNPIAISIPTTLECKPQNLPDEWLKCYESNPYWVSGLIRSYSKSFEDFTTQVNVVHYSDYLKSKVIDTQQFNNSLLSTVFPVIFDYYAGLTSSLVNIISYTDRRIVGPISGNSILEELRYLAQVGKAHLFVQTDGRLTIEKWKDHTWDTECVIPPELIISVERGEYSKPDTTMIKISGASLLGMTCASSEISNNNLGQSAIKKCVISGRETPVVKLTFNNLNGDSEDIKTTEISGDINQDDNTKQNVSAGSFSANFRKNNLDWFGPDPTVVNLSLTNKSKSNRDEAIFGNKHLMQDKKNERKIQNKIQRIIAKNFPVPKSSFGLGAYGEPAVDNSNTDSQRTQDSYSEIYTYIYKGNGLGSDCGIAMESINNKYAADLEALFSLGLRRFQEIEMSQAVYNLTLPYIPCLKLNQVIEFNIPESCCPVQTIKGVIQEIQINAETDENGVLDITMKVAVNSVECLGKTTYTSGNLIRNYCTDNTLTTGLNGWQTSALNLEEGSGFDGTCIYLWAKNTRYVTLTYNHLPDMDAVYNISFLYRNLIGNYSNTATFTGGIIGVAFLNGDSGFSADFTPALPWIDFQWALAAPLNQTKYIKICNLQLTKTVVG